MPSVPTLYTVLIQILVLFERVSSIDNASALHLILTLFEVISSEDLIAMSTPPPFLLYRLGFEGSGGCVSGLRSHLNIL